MGEAAVPTSQQHMTAGFILVTTSDVVSASTVKFLFVVFGLACLSLFQSMLMKIMFAPAVVCGTGPVPCSVAADDVNVDHGDDIAGSGMVKQKVKYGSSA